MSNLIEKDECGSWELKDVPWYDLMPGAIIKQETHTHIYTALCKLRDYEQTGLSPGQVWDIAAGCAADELIEAVLAAGILQYGQESYVRVQDAVKIIKEGLPYDEKGVSETGERRGITEYEPETQGK